MLDRKDGVEMLGIDGSDDMDKYAMVSFWAEILIIA